MPFRALVYEEQSHEMKVSLRIHYLLNYYQRLISKCSSCQEQYGSITFT